MVEKKLRVIIAGQLPPPVGGQNIMVQKALAQFRQSSAFSTEHLPFLFTPDVTKTRRGGTGKLLELGRVIARLLRLRLRGSIDLLLYPAGGPQKVPLLRDLLLFPWVLTLSRKVIVHFHAAGIADELRKPTLLPRLVAGLYGKAFGAVVNSNFNRKDPEAVGIKRIAVVPCRLSDEFDAQLLNRSTEEKTRLLYVGHLCPDKGTPQLLQAYASVRKRFPGLTLELVGECLPPFTNHELEQWIDRLEIRPSVKLSGVLTGRAKAEAFGRADLFVFPSVAPYESFGLVLAEAMSWRLPILATNWRGNRDVLTRNPGAIVFDVSGNLAMDLVSGLTEALRQRHQWIAWGKMNRTIFEEFYDDKCDPEWLLRPITALVCHSEN